MAGAALDKDTDLTKMLGNMAFLTNFHSPADGVVHWADGAGDKGFSSDVAKKVGAKLKQILVPDVKHFEDDQLATAGAQGAVKGPTEWDSYNMARGYYWRSFGDGECYCDTFSRRYFKESPSGFYVDEILWEGRFRGK